MREGNWSLCALRNTCRHTKVFRPVQECNLCAGRSRWEVVARCNCRQANAHWRNECVPKHLSNPREQEHNPILSRLKMSTKNRQGPRGRWCRRLARTRQSEAKGSDTPCLLARAVCEGGGGMRIRAFSRRFAQLGCMTVVLAGFFVATTHADTLEMKNGSLIHGKFVGGSEFNIRFLVNGVVKYYSTKDILTLTFDSSTAAPAPATPPPAAPAATPVPSANPQPAPTAAEGSTVTVPAGTVISVRMIDSVDSATNQVGDQFHASLENDLVVNNVVVAPKGADVYGKLEQVKSAGDIKGQSQLQLGLTGIRINGTVVPITTGDYSVAGASRGKQSAERNYRGHCGRGKRSGDRRGRWCRRGYGCASADERAAGARPERDGFGFPTAISVHGFGACAVSRV